jgi:hypothetical protein
MFDAATLPAPPAGSTAYVLRNILHDWDDAACLAILRALRSRVAGGDGGSSSSSTRLLIIEATLSEEVLPCHLPIRQVLGGWVCVGVCCGHRGRGAVGATRHATCHARQHAHAHRHTSDLMMLANFGDACERSPSQFAALLAAAGWRMLRVRPTSGVFVVVVAAPA